MSALRRALYVAELTGLGVAAAAAAAVAVVLSIPAGVLASAYLVGQLSVSLSTPPVEVP